MSCVENLGILEGGNVQVHLEVKTQHEKNDMQSEEGCSGGQGD